MKRIHPILLITLFFALVSTGQVRVIKPAGQKTTINISSLRPAADATSRSFFQTLEKDLRLSGWLLPVRSGGDVTLSGTIQNNGRTLKTLVQAMRPNNRARLFSNSYSIDSARARSLAHRVADDLIQAITGHKGFASSKIAVVGNRNGVKELYLCDADGGGLVQLTRDKNIVVGPNWSPDGSSLIFTSFLRNFPDVYRIDLKRGKRDKLAGYGGLNTGAALSPNGQELALILSRDGNPELYIKTLRDGRLRRLTATARATEASPCFSPDGKSLVYVSDQSGSPQLYIISRTGGRPRRLSSRGTQNVAPDWGANGKIACSSRTGGRYVIAIIDPTSGQTKYIPSDAANYEAPSWAPDGRHLFASRTVNYQSSLYLLDTISDPPVALLEGGGNWQSPACSPR